MQKFLRLFVMTALLFVPWITMGQNAQVSEYDYSVSTATYSTIVGTSGATAWTAANQTAGYVDVAMPFAMYFGETQVPATSNLRVYGNGSATFEGVTGLEDSRLAPLYYASGYTTTATSVYTKSSAQQLVVEWRKLTANGNSYSFQLKLYPGGDIEFCYGPMTINSTLSVFTGLMSATDDVFRTRGEGGTLYWNTLERATDYATRTLSTAYSPEYNATTGQGLVYNFTQPACVKPNTLAAASIDGGANLSWNSRATSFQIKYSTDANFDPATEGTQTTSTATTKTLTGLTNFTTYYWAVRAVCSGTPSAWSEVSSFMAGTVVNMGDQTTLTTCNAMILDDGGADGSYSDGADQTLVVAPATAGKRIRLVGTYYTEGCCDGLTIYDGDSTTGLVLGTFYGDGNIDVHGENGAVTLVFTSDGSVNYDGFALTATCENIPTCPNPAAPEVTAEGVVTWTASTNATSYDILWGATGFNPASAGTAVNGLTGTTTTLEGLASTTTYDVYLRAHCSATNEVTEWIGPATFTTPCIGSCTHTITMSDDYGDGWEGHTIDLYVNGTFQESITLSSGSSGEATVYLCPGTTYEYRWQWNGGNQYGENNFTITDHNNDVIYSCVAEAGLSDGLVLVTGQSCFTPNCPHPSITSATAEGVITWEASTNATSYEIKYGVAGFDVETEGTLVQNLTGTTHTLTGLASSTNYDVYLRAICSATNETSEWSVVASFTTACMPVVINATTSINEGFEGTSVPATCWSVVYANPSYPSGNAMTHATTYYYSGSRSFRFSSYSSGSPYDQYLISPQLSCATTMDISFWYRRHNSGDNIQFGYSTTGSDTSDFIWGDWTSGSASTWYNYEATVPANTKYVAIHYYGSYAYYAYIDDFQITKTPTCPKPNTIATTATTPNSATLTWTENGTATEWNVLYGPTGFNPETEGTTVNANGTATVTLSDLTGNTVYDVYVRSVCVAGVDISGWSNVYTFRTECGTLSLPYSEDFSSYTGLPSYPYNGPAITPACWNYYSNGTNTAETSGSSYYGGVGYYNYTSSYAALTAYDNYLCLPAFNCSTAASTTYQNYLAQRGNVRYAVFPQFTTAINNMLLSFDYKMSVSTATNTLYLGYITTDTSSFTVLATYPATTTIQNVVELDLSALASNAPAGARLAFKWENLTKTSNYGTTAYCGIDNIAIRQIPNCNSPINVAASDVTNSTAVITWTERTNPAATNWTLKYGPAGFDPETEGTAVAVSTTPSYELTSLDVYAYYDVYVRAECSAIENSEWSDVYTFRTVCPDGGSAAIGEAGNSSTYGPALYGNYGNSYCQQIYTAEELTAAGLQAGEIAAITFTWTNNASYAKEFTIYMGQTEQSSFESTTAWVPLSEQTLVYATAPHPLNTSGTVQYDLQNTFVWDGVSNIVVTDFMNQPTGVNQSNSGFYSVSTTTSPVYRCMYLRKDNSQYTTEQVSGTASGRTYLRSDITFIRPCNTSVTCFAPNMSAPTITPANVVTVTWAARTDLRPIVNNFELKYGPEGFDPETQGVLVPALNNTNTYTINAELSASTNYDVYVRTVCDADNDEYSPWAKASFTTYPTCWVPVDLTVSTTTQTSATLSWANNELVPTNATRWEVCYGPEGFGDPEYYGTKVETTNNTAFEVTGLNHSRKYEFYVRALCSATDKSDWSAVATGTTQCGVWQYADMPLVENFDGYTGNTSGTVANHRMPNCWSYLNLGTNTTYMGLPSIYSTASYSHSTPNTLRFYAPTAATNGDQIAVLPEFGFDLDTLEISFYARFGNASSALTVGVMSDPTDAETFVPVETVNAPSTGYTTQALYEVSFSEYTGSARYVAFKAIHSTSAANYVYMDDLTVKLREKVNTLPNNGGTVVACNEFVMPDTTGGSYAGNLNATYVVRPAQAGYVARLQGNYDLENGYDFLNVYRGAVNANNLVGRYTGTDSIDYMTSSNLWVDSGYFTLVFTTDADNAFANTGFKFLVTCEQPLASEDTIQDVVVENGTYTWTAGNGQTYVNHSTLEAAPDRTEDITYPVVNVAGFDSVYRHLDLTVHPTYELSYPQVVICDRDEYEFYGQTYTTTGNYTVTLQSIYGADSVGILNLQVNPAPTVGIYYNNRAVTEVNDYCDNFDMALVARSNESAATFVWDDESTAANRVVNPHETNTYTVVATNPATGCTSLPATLTVTTTPVPALTISGDAEICYGQSATLTVTDANNVDAAYRWSNGATTTSITVNPTETTTYTVTATTNNASACAVTAEYTVTVNPLPVVTATASVSEICRDSIVTLTASAVEGYTYEWSTGATTAVATAAAATTGAYTVTVTDQNGCVNNFNTASVTVYPSYEQDVEMSVCYINNPYTWGNMTITADGNYDQNFTIAHGCDSLVHLNFTFQQMGVENTYREVCEGTEVTWGSETITATETTTLTYIDNSGECPVQYNLYLTVNHPAATSFEHVVCDSYTWPVSGETYTVSGAYPYTLATTKGCDSVVTMNLTVNYQNTGVETVTACDNYVWNLNGVNYTATTNEPTFTLQNQWGCDSVVTLDLTVNYRSYHEDFHCVRDAESYTWLDNETYTLNVNVEDGIEHVIGDNALGCDSVFQLHLVLNPVANVLNWATVEACDEYEVANAVVFDDEDDCNGHVEPLYLRESGDYEVRTRTDANDISHDQLTRIHLTVTPSTYHTTIVTECLPYTWTITDANDQPFEIATITADMVNGASVYNTSVDMAEAGYVASSCSQIEVLRLTPKYPTTETIEATICQNGSWAAPAPYVYTVNGTDLNVGENTQTYNTNSGDVNEAGCPLNKVVLLTVNPVYNETMDLAFCESEFVLNETSGDYELTVNDANHEGASVVLTIPGALNQVAYNDQVVANWQTALGCDSNVTINYTVYPVLSETATAVACYEYTWELTGTVYDTPGTYTDNYEYADEDNNGCTHIVTLNLTVNDTARSYDTIPVCTSYKYNGETYRKTMTFREEAGVAKSSCDSVRYVTYEVQQNKLNEQYVYSNAPYTWANGTEYSASIEGVFYDVPVAEGCDSVLMLHFTMGEPIAFCENELPKTITIGTTSFVIPVDAVSGVWNNGDAQGNDTIIAYTILRNTTQEYTETACDSYTWMSGDSATYTQSGVYTWMTTNAAGCDSTATLTLTINNSNAETVTEVACDNYTWTTGNGETYTTSGNYVYNTTNVAGCDSVVTLALTINVNNGVEQTVAACVEYTWEATGLTYNASGDYTKSFTDVNGCTGDSVLHLTINQPITVEETIVVNADTASYRFNGVLYTAPYDYNTDGDIVVDTISKVTGCDSTYTLHLVIPFVNHIDTLNVNACGTYTWARNNHLYTWIPMSERQSHGYALFKDVTDNKYIYSYPVDTTFVNGAMTGIQMLVLNLMEAEYHTDTLNLPLSLGTYTINGIDAEHNVTYNFAGETVEGTQFYSRDTVMEASVAYCANYVDYTVNLVNNYTIYRDTVCAEQTSYTWHGDNVIGTPGHTFAYEYVENAGTLDETVDSMYLYQLPVNNTAVAVVTACDSTEWNGTWYYATGTDTYATTTARGCDSTITLNLTVNASTHAAFNAEACDTYEWVNNGNTFNYTETGVYTNNYVNAAGCASTDTLHLTINNNSNQGYTAAACNSYEWERNGETYTTSGDKLHAYIAANGCPSVDTLHLTINLPTSAGETVVACDSTEWNGTKYTVSGTYYYNYNTEAGCASVDTLYLTVNNATHNSETLAQCDSYEWNGQTYTTSGDYTYAYTNAAGCASTDTLHLTINVNNTGVDTTVTACDEFTWNVNARLYNTTGTYTARTTDENGCATTNTLHLNINSTSSYDSVLYISDGSYRYTDQNGTQTFYEPGVYSVTEHYTNAAQCDSSLNITLNVGTALLEVEAVTNCSEYTWRNGKTYTWLSAEERAAHAVDGQNALYYNATDQAYVYYNPTYTVPQQNNYDSVYILSLTLTQSVTTTDVVNFPISLGVLTYGDSIFDFSALDSKDFAGATEYHEVHFASNYYCDSIVDLTINLVNNYTEVATDDICVTQTEYTWRGQTISTATNDFDNAHTYYIYEVQENADSLLTTVEYMTLTQHPVVYATERRTACDSYTWNGNTYTESTSHATFDTVDRFGCDSTVTLMLTIKKSTDSVLTQIACESFTWNGVEYTESAEVVIDNLTNAVGCDSTATLHLTVNYNTNTEYTVDECDSYTWTAENGGNGNTYTTSGTYTYDYNTAEGCPSTNTLNLTIRNNSNQTFTETACDTYTWSAANGGNGETYTTSGVYTYDYEAENGCPSTNTLNLTVNQNSSAVYTVTDACDSMDWHGMRYVSGDYTYDYADANNCPSVDTLHLTVNNATHNSMTVVECNSYTWTEGDGNTYTVGGTYTYGYVNAAGCASTDTLHLTIGTGRAYGIERVTNCGPYTWIVNGEEIATLDESVETSTTVTNPATGCDSTIYLYLTINPLTVTEAAICDNQTYTWTVNSTEYSEAGTYSVPVNDAEGNCLSEERLVLTVNPTEVTNLTDQICLGNGYNANGFVIAASELPAAGEYTFVDHLATVNGCDSTVNLTLTVGDIINNPVEAVACDTYTWLAGDDETYTYTVSGTYNSGAYANAQGCTTVDVLTLTINNNSSTEYSEIVCDGYMWNGTQYTESGDYTYDYTDGNGCASTDVLHLTVNASTINTVEETACDSYTWENGDGETYTASGVYTYNYTTDNGCNGTTYLVLTVKNSTTGSEAVTACDSYTWNNTLYEQSGTYTFETTNAAGCDSTATLNLTINTSTVGTDVQTACDSYEWIDGNVYTASNNTATYTLTNAAGCDSVVTLNLTINNSVASSFDAESCNSYVWENTYYTESGVYTKTLEAANGCDSVVTMTLVIKTPVEEAIAETACSSYTWNGITYNASGAYTQTFTGANGCDSVVTLTLTVNQPVASAVAVTACESYVWNGETYTTSGDYTYTTTAANGCDSVVTLTLTINTPANTTEEATACESYTWHGQVYTTNGAYTYNFTDANGCAAVATLNLTINTPVNTTESVTACNSYSWNNQTYTNSGVYTSTFVDANGCNATATLNLTINTTVNAYVSATACESYTWNGQTYTTSGNYTFTATAANGCDSVTTLTLTINQPTTATVYAEACGSYTWNGQTYTQPGAYPYTTTGSNGCDSTVTLLLNLVQPVQTIINQTACDSYTWNNQTYTTSGSYTYTATAANGCDSVVTLNLTINNSVSGTFAETACNSYTWNGQAYTTSGTYTQVFTAHNGCDSTVTLNLTINTPTTATVTETACSSFDWNGDTYTQSGSYTYTTTGANGCDSVTTLLLTINLPVYTNLEVNAEGSYSWNGETYTESGVYTYTTTAANGCDSVVTLTLTITPVYTVTLVSSNDAWGSVSESGTVAEYGYFTAEATANEGYEFVAWLHGTDTVSTSSTYIFQVTEDITLTAVFAEIQGISVADMNNVVIYSNDTRIFVNGAEGYDVYVYDVNGRVISRQLKAADAIEFRMSTTGVYLVKVGNAPAKRVIVVR